MKRKILYIVKKSGLSEINIQKFAEFACNNIARTIKTPKKLATPFFILMQGRSGSTVLCDLLDSHPSMRCQSEIFTFQKKQPLRYISNLHKIYSFLEKSAWGFKAKVPQIENNGYENVETFYQELTENQYHLFTLSRENHLRTALSNLVGWRRGNQFHNDRNQKNIQKVTIEGLHLIDATKRIKRSHDNMLETTKNFNFTHFTYEKNLATADKQIETCNAIFQQLKLEPFEVKSNFKKTSARYLIDYIENAEQLHEEVSKSEFASMLPPLKPEKTPINP